MKKHETKTKNMFSPQRERRAAESFPAGDGTAMRLPYAAPALEEIEVCVEHGFAGSIENPEKVDDDEFWDYNA